MCPKCENYLTFDETPYTAGQSLVFVCEHCKKQFSIRIGRTKLKEKQRNEAAPASEASEWGWITVVENRFGYQQQFALHEGDNLIGRRSPGSQVDIAIETADPSMDRRHCFIQACRRPTGERVFTLRDHPSLTGTFLQNHLLADKDRAVLRGDEVITLGATTLIFHAPDAAE